MDQQLTEEVYVGLDTHRETIHGTALDKNGTLICSYEFPNGEEAMKEFLKKFSPWNTLIAMEACGIWRGCYKILNKLGYRVKLANPLKCHQLAKDKKTDKVDSRILADLTRIGYLPEVYIPSDEIIALRDLTRHKCNLSRLLVRVKNKVKAILLREGIKYDDEIWDKDGIFWLRGLNHEKINDFTDLYEIIHEKIKKVSKEIDKAAKNKEETRLLDSIPGIASFGAALIFAEIGDIERFPDPKHLHAYAGAVPGIYQSGTKTKTVKKKEVNHWLKWICGQCSYVALKSKNKIQKHYQKVLKKKSWKTARKAASRKLLTIIWHVLKEKQPYHES
jgi:transposase